jgi:thiol-disulfide isomerase/thioredoxin
MARTPTTQIPLGFKAPDFSLVDVTSSIKTTLKDVSKKNGLVVMFICNHCPFVVHVLEQILALGSDYLIKDIGFVAISSNDVINYPDDSPEKMKELAKSYNFPFPYLYDPTQEVAKNYDAACTPDFSVFDGELKCIYRGQLDNSRPGNKEPVNGKDLRLVLDLLLKNKKIDFIQKPSIGCNIKWK